MAAEPDKDSPEMTAKEAYRLWTGLFILAAVLALPLGFGYMFGAGAGWIVFAAVAFICAMSFNKLYKET
jgi:hypothetical protein